MWNRIWLVAILVLIALPLVQDPSPAQQTFSGSPGLKVADPGRAKEIYRRDCLVCHGANGDGRTDILRDRDMNLPDWTDPRSLEEHPDQQLFNIIRFGRGKMPAERTGRADDAEVRSLIRFIRTMSKDEALVNRAGSAESKR